MIKKLQEMDIDIFELAFFLTIAGITIFIIFSFFSYVWNGKAKEDFENGQKYLVDQCHQKNGKAFFDQRNFFKGCVESDLTK